MVDLALGNMMLRMMMARVALMVFRSAVEVSVSLVIVDDGDDLGTVLAPAVAAIRRARMASVALQLVRALWCLSDY